MLQKLEKFISIDSISFSETSNVYDAMNIYFESLKFLQDDFSEPKAIIDFIKSRYIKNSEPYLLTVNKMRNSLVKIDWLCDLIQTICNSNRGVSCE